MTLSFFHTTVYILLVNVSQIGAVDNLADPAVLGISLLVVPFGRIVKPAQKEGAKRRSVRENKEGINAVLLVVAADRSHKLMHANSHVKGAFSKRKASVELSVTV